MNKVIEDFLSDIEENGLEILNYNQDENEPDSYLITTNYAILHLNTKTGELIISFSIITTSENSAVLALMFERLEHIKKIEISRSYYATKDGVVMGDEAYKEYHKKLIEDVSKEIFLRQKQLTSLNNVECFHC